MQEQIINFQTAKLAKEKGFNEGSENYYENDGTLRQQWPEEGGIHNQENDYGWELNYFEAPTQSLLQRWLREVHKIHISLHFNRGASWTYIISELSYDGSWTKDYPERSYESYESALEDGLYHALQLIK